MAHTKKSVLEKIAYDYFRVFNIRSTDVTECVENEFDLYGTTAYLGESAYYEALEGQNTKRLKECLSLYYFVQERVNLSQVSLPFELIGSLYEALCIFYLGVSPKKGEGISTFEDFFFNYYLELPLLSDKE